MITGALQVGNTGHNWGDIRICRHGMLRGAHKLAKESPGLKRNHQWSVDLRTGGNKWNKNQMCCGLIQ